MSGSLSAEIKQAKPFQSLSHEAFLALLRTTDQVRRDLGRVVFQQGVTLQQYNVLRILRGAGDPGLPTLEIVTRMIEETPGITRLIDRLEDRGLVTRERGADDRRQVLCRISSGGLEILERLDQPVADHLARALSLPEDMLADLILLLDTLRRHHRETLSADSGPPLPPAAD